MDQLLGINAIVLRSNQGAAPFAANPLRKVSVLTESKTKANATKLSIQVLCRLFFEMTGAPLSRLRSGEDDGGTKVTQVFDQLMSEFRGHMLGDFKAIN